MNKITRRKLIASGAAVTAGAAGLAIAAKVGNHFGLIPPDSGGIFGAGETLTYGAHRLLTRHSLAREFSKSQISKDPFANSLAPLGDDFQRLQSAGFSDWKLSVDGMAANPTTFSLSEIKKFPAHSQITQIACEEGWSYIAEWIGTPLHDILKIVQPLPQVRYVVYRSIQPDWWDSIDMADALHPQTFVTFGMNGGDLPVGFGGPLRLRVPRQLGYKSVKFITSLTLTDNLKSFGKGLGSASPEGGYAWYAGI